jgi:transcriptional regulator with XRE-family HTH domain
MGIVKNSCEKHDFCKAFADEPQVVLGANLRQWRIMHGRKMEATAEELGVSTATWGHWETGHSFPTSKMLFLLAEYTSWPLPKLLCPFGLSCDRCPISPSDRKA